MGWAEQEFETIDLGDPRLNRRAVLLAERLGQKPGASIPGACENWAETAAAYRFLRNEQVNCEEVMTAHAQFRGQKARAPVRGATRCALQRGRDHPLDLLVEDAARHARAGCIAQAFDALLAKAPPPFSHRQVADAQARCDSQIGGAWLGAAQHDAGTKCQTLRGGAPTCPASQSCPISIRQGD